MRNNSKKIQTYRAAEFTERLFHQRKDTISVCVPAHNEEATIGHIAGVVVSLVERGLIDQVLVVDDRSTDRTAEVATQAGAQVVRSADLHAELGPVVGRCKGDVMWRALEVLTGDIIIYVDGDSGVEFGEHFVLGLAGPLLNGQADFVKGAYEKPYRARGTVIPRREGRVGSAVRPVLDFYFPDLHGIEQPLAGEVAARRAVVDEIPFELTYGVEVGNLIDASQLTGRDRLAQVDLGMRQNAHQSIEALRAMGGHVLRAILTRALPDMYQPGEMRPPHARD